MMDATEALKDQPLLEIAAVLGVPPDTVLQWIIEEKLLVALQGSQTILLVDAHQTLHRHNSGRLLILSKQPASQSWRTFSC